jgi:hypothetical protein
MLSFEPLHESSPLIISHMRFFKSSQMIMEEFQKETFAKKALREPPFYGVQRYSFFANDASFS